MTRTRKWVRTTIAEPFPVFYSHINQQCRRASGPFYAANSQWFDLPKNLAYRQRCADHLRADGYTVTVEMVDC